MVVSVNVVRYELVLYAGSGSRCEHDVRSSSTSQHGSHPSAGLGSHCGTGRMDVLWSLWSVMLMCMYLCKPVRTSKHRSLSIHRESKKGCHPNHGYNFVNSWSICKILSLLQTAVNFQQNPYWVTHHTLSMLLHYLGKLKNQKFALCMHVKRLMCDFLSPMQQISVKCHENKCKD